MHYELMYADGRVVKKYSAVSAYKYWLKHYPACYLYKVYADGARVRWM